jgi:hypothetical protein
MDVQSEEHIMSHMHNHLRTIPILLTAGLALIASSCAPAATPNPPATLGDLVWMDTNSNGMQDPAEPGAVRIEVSLYREDNTLVGSTVTDERGLYRFEDLPSGRYFLTFIALQENDFTLPDVGGNDEVDSDANPIRGRTEAFDFDSSLGDQSRDAGLTFKTTPSRLPPPENTPTPEPTWVTPPTGGVFEFHAAFTKVDEGDNNCGLTAYFEDGLVIEVTEDGQTITFRQPSTGDVNSGEILPDGSFEVSSERESYLGRLEILRDESGKIVRVILYAINTYEDVYGCITRYEVEGETEVQDN